MFGEFNMVGGIISEVGDIELEIPKLKIKIEMWGGGSNTQEPYNNQKTSITYAGWEIRW